MILLVTPDFEGAEKPPYIAWKSIPDEQLKRTGLDTKEFGLPPIRPTEQNAAYSSSVSSREVLLDRELERILSNQYRRNSLASSARIYGYPTFSVSDKFSTFIGHTFVINLIQTVSASARMPSPRTGAGEVLRLRSYLQSVSTQPITVS
ncbi:hypothetical protein N7490_006597 [Penicillium lividum]|nr:hypothetical protein N7490_006597 [Penicillium lividum]